MVKSTPHAYSTKFSHNKQRVNENLKKKRIDAKNCHGYHYLWSIRQECSLGQQRGLGSGRVARFARTETSNPSPARTENLQYPSDSIRR